MIVEKTANQRSRSIPILLALPDNLCARKTRTETHVAVTPKSRQGTLSAHQPSEQSRAIGLHRTRGIGT
jgi:predicted Abi (CAAX) family protease